jgi:hypothetical protein
MGLTTAGTFSTEEKNRYRGLYRSINEVFLPPVCPGSDCYAGIRENHLFILSSSILIFDHQGCGGRRG